MAQRSTLFRARKPKTAVLMLAAAAFALVGSGSKLQAANRAGASSRREVRSNAIKPKVGERVPDFSFTGLDGHSYRLSDFSGHYVLLDFWATWCSLCLEEEPTLAQAYRQFRGRGLVIVGLDSDKNAAKALEYVNEHHIAWPESSPASTKDVLARDLQVKWYPAMVLLDPQGRIVMVSGNGGRFLRGKNLLHALDGTLPPNPVAGMASSSTSQ